MNCAMMGIDWRGLTLRQYFDVLVEHNERHSDKKPAGEVSDTLRRLMKARMANDG